MEMHDVLHAPVTIPMWKDPTVNME